MSSGHHVNCRQNAHQRGIPDNISPEIVADEDCTLKFKRIEQAHEVAY